MEYSVNTYVGFWARAGAVLIDALLFSCLTLPLILYHYGWDYFDPDYSDPFSLGEHLLLDLLLPSVLTLGFWLRWQATPGKMAVSARIVDAASGQPARPLQLLGRCCAYLISMLPLGLGVLWIAFDRRKQAWHDKLAGTLVIREGHTTDTPPIGLSDFF